MNSASIVKKGFTVVELVIVIVVISIIAAIAVVSYSSIIAQARDEIVQADVDAVQSSLKRIAARSGGEYHNGLNWNSESGPNSEIGVVPSDETVVSVIVREDAYCIRAYNPQSNTKTLATAKKVGSNEFACNDGWQHIVTGGATNYNVAHTCAQGTNLRAYCWGNNNFGQLGDGSVSQATVHRNMQIGTRPSNVMKHITLGGAHSCLISIDNYAYCWGNNNQGQVANGSLVTDESTRVPRMVVNGGAASGLTVKQIAAGARSTCTIASNNKVYCWGALMSNATSPVEVGGAMATKSIKAISVGIGDSGSNTPSSGTNHACALATDNLMYCWGRNNAGQLGNGTTTTASSPVLVGMNGDLAGKTIRKISTGAEHTCVIANDSQAYCWGAAGKLGTASGAASLTPVAVSTTGVLAGKTIRNISAGQGHTCVTTHDDNAYCWGTGTNGQLGNGSTTANSNIPVQVTLPGPIASKGFTSISTGYNYTCATTRDLSAYCWGARNHGRVGNSTTSGNALTPALVTRSF